MLLGVDERPPIYIGLNWGIREIVLVVLKDTSPLFFRARYILVLVFELLDSSTGSDHGQLTPLYFFPVDSIEEGMLFNLISSLGTST